MHLRGRQPGDWGARQSESSATAVLDPRQTNNSGDSQDDNGNDNNSIRFAAFVVIGVLALLLILIGIVAHHRSRKRRLNLGTRPRGAQETKGKRTLWARINPFKSSSSQYQATSGDDSAELNNTNSTSARTANQAQSNGNTAGATIDRNTSIRSVLTLPAYSRTASHTEQIIGREGDRDGVDVVVDFPTDQDEEALREQEMDALYQLRATRRRQQADREEMRRQRQEARDRNDYMTLTELRNRARAASNSNQSLVEDLRRDIERAKENRQRSVSSVSYADLGVARHDGTRIRGNSQESERQGLLSDAADMGHLTRSRAESPSAPGRHRSASDAHSVDSDLPSPAFMQTRRDSQPDMSRLSAQSGRAGSTPELVESDLGVETMPPPEYEDVSLDDDEAVRSTTPMHEPPPDYPGPYRSDSQRSRSSQPTQGSNSSTTSGDRASRGRGVDGIPQLPSLRISHLPEIRIEPSSARPRDDESEDDRR